MTVRGAVAPQDIGPTMMHEHLFHDTEVYWDPSELQDPELGLVRIEPRYAGPARWNNTAFRDNLAFLPDQDYELLVEEVREFHGAGGSCIVDLSNQGIGPFPEATKRLATELEMHVVLGCGFYIHDSHPDWLENASVNDLEDALATELREGILQSGVRPGIIGEIGTSEQLHPCEERVLRAAARVAHRTGTAINVHAHPPDLAVVMRIIDILVGEQEVDADRIYISHLDEIVDVDYHARVLERGVVVGFDSFGQDGYYTPTWKSRSDLEKMTTLAKMVEFGFAAQLVVAQDLGRKHYLRANGGMGFDHVISRVLPRLQTNFGIDESVIQELLVKTPRRLLTRPGSG